MSQRFRDLKINIERYVYNANTFGVLINMALVINVIYFIMFLMARQFFMAVYDVGIIIYLVTVMKSRDENDKNSLSQMLCLLALVFLQSVLGCAIMGVESGFNMLLLSVIPVCFFVEYLVSDSSAISYIVSAVALVTNIVVICMDALYVSDGRVVTAWSKVYMVYNWGVAIVLTVFSATVFMAEVFTISNGQERQIKRLNELANYDPLTGLLLRRPLLEQLESCVEKKRVYGRDYAICIGDIDFFKKFNDNYGHECGDIVLKTVASSIRKGVRECDFVCRWGGEEILILFPDTSSYEAAKVMERVRKDIEGMSHTYKGQEVRVTMTFGVSSSEKHIMSQEIIESADMALYRGKEAGRNRVESC